MIDYLKTQSETTHKHFKRVTFFSLFFAMLFSMNSLSIQAQTQNLSLSVNKVTLRQFFSKIETQSNYKFSFRDVVVDQIDNITYQATNQTINQILSEVLDGYGLKFEIDGSNIVVTSKTVAAPKKNDKNRRLQGSILDKKTGEALIGANIMIKGSNTRTISDYNGNFEIEVNDNSVLAINYIGYSKVEIPVGQSQKLKVQLEDNALNVNEVVVIGYGSAKKVDLTSSISSISAKDLKSQPAVSSEIFLQGRAAGVQVATNTGAPGSTVSVKIRGVVSSGNTDPLYVVDGMPMSSGTGDNSFGINSLNPSDIESIQILKDASSAAIYGSRGSNGVVLITTKRGKSGKPTINLETYYGTQNQAHKISVLNKNQYKQYYDMLGPYQIKASSNAEYGVFTDPALYATLPDIDWQSKIFNTAPTSNVQLSLSGGSESSVFMVSLGNTSQDGLVKGSTYNRTNFRINSDHTINKWLKFGESLSLSYASRHRVMEGGVGYNYVSASPIICALVSDPTSEPFNSDGTINYMRRSGNFNAIGVRDRSNYVYNNKKINGNIYFDVSLMKELKFKTNVGLDYNLGETKEFLTSFLVVGSPLNEEQATNNLKQFDNHTTYMVVENTLTYNKTFGKHTLGVMLGQTAEINSVYSLEGASVSIPGSLPYLQYLSAGNPSDPNRYVGGEASEWRMNSYLARLNYSFKDLYLLTASVRNDNSSKFGANKRSATFPAASLAWKIKNEAFLKDVDWLYMAKIRFGWGLVGNQNNISWYNVTNMNNANYAFGNPKGGVGATSTPGLSAGYVYYGYSGADGGAPANPDLTWETTQTKDIGVDVSLFENKISFTADWFLKDNIGMLMTKTVPGYLGFAGPTVNGGKIANEGLEFETTYRKNEGDFTFDMGFNLTYIKTKVVELDPTQPYMYFGSNYVDGVSSLSRTIVNGGIADFWGLKTNGVFKDDADVAKGPFQQGSAAGGTKAGDVKFVDMNGDGKISLDDYTVIGSPLPDFTYGLTMNLYYKNFDLNIFAQGVQGNEIYNNLYRVMMGPWGINHSTDILNSWTPTNTNTNIPRIEESSFNNNKQFLTDRWIQDGSYFRLKTMSLGYTVPKKWLNRASIQNLRIYATVQNLLTLTNYKGFDPEISQSVGWGSSSLDLGVDNGNYPQPRTILVGFNITL